MVMEVYAGARPGRPRLLFLLAAGLLVGALALAWAQVRSTRALGPEQRVGNLPMYVRLPLKWQAVPDHPHTYVLAVEGRGQRGITFGYLRAPAFQSMQSVIRFLRLDESALPLNPSPARIGGYEGVEVHSIEVRREWRRYVKKRERLVRFATLPNGQLIYAEYEPLVDLRPADYEIFEDVCHRIRIDDPALTGTADEHLQHAGLKLPPSTGWLVLGADYDVAGVYVGGTEDQLPAYALSIFRTWLSADRTPRDLLLDFAAELWRQWDPPPEIRAERRADGATVLTMRSPRFGRTEEPLQAVWIISQAPDRVAIICAQAGAAKAEMADAAARDVALKLELQPIAELAGLTEAAEAGQRLAGQLREAGPVARWGREVLTVDFHGHDALGPLSVSSMRRAVQRDPRLGYEGTRRMWRGGQRSGRADEEQAWRIRLEDSSYVFEASSLLTSVVPVTVQEQRAGSDGRVKRQVTMRAQEQTWSYQPGAGFVPPPLESAICGWVARGEAPRVISEWSSLVGPGTYTALLRQLPADGQFPRVLVQEDYWPIGYVQAYDDDQAELVYELFPTGELRRVTEDKPVAPHRP